MSAQTSEAVLPNGVGRDESSAQQGSAGAHNVSDQVRTGAQDDSSRRQTRDASLPDARQGMESRNWMVSEARLQTPLQQPRQCR